MPALITAKEEVMAQFDTIIKGGTIVDGTRVPRYGADVGMKNGKIAQIGRLHSSDAKQVMDMQVDCLSCPGSRCACRSA
jgi:N-acyl-D-aspartate/D-glutamate deacylase